MSVNISLIVLKKMYDILMIFVDFCGKFPWFWPIFCYLDPFHWSGSGSGWPKWNGSKRIRIATLIIIHVRCLNILNFGSWFDFLGSTKNLKHFDWCVILAMFYRSFYISRERTPVSERTILNVWLRSTYIAYIINHNSYNKF